jgi:hypothetical protein
MTDTTFSEDFMAHTKKMIAEHRTELGPYEDGSAEARPGQGGRWENATLDRIAEIKREIMALEDSLARHGETLPEGPKAALTS